MGHGVSSSGVKRILWRVALDGSWVGVQIRDNCFLGCRWWRG